MQLLVLVTLPDGTQQYFPSSKFTTTDTSMTVPVSLPAGQTFALLITTLLDGNANFETSPLRSGLPTAFASVVSAPMTIGPQAAPMVVRGDARFVPTGGPIASEAEALRAQVQGIRRKN